MVRSQADNPYDIEQAESDIGDLRGSMSYLGEVASAQNFNLPGATGATFSGPGAVTGASLANLSSQYTVPALHPNAGAIYQIECWGTASWGTASAQLQLSVNFGGTNFTTFTLAANAFASGASVRWHAKAKIFIVAAGSSGSAQSAIDAEFSDFGNVLNGSQGTTGASMAATVSDSSGTAVSTAIANTFALQAAWSVTTGSPSITAQILNFSRVA